MSFILEKEACQDLSLSARKEWLLTNGIGGFAMGTACGINTRRYHGLLVAATQPPATRMVLLAGMECQVSVDHIETGISSNQYPGAIFPEGYKVLERFSADLAVRSSYRTDQFQVERAVAMHAGINATTIRYTNEGRKRITLLIRPLVCHKPYHDNFEERPGYPQQLTFPENQTVVSHDGVSLYLTHLKAYRTPVQGWYYRFEHQIELERGLPPRDDLFCPCELQFNLKPGESINVVASTEPNTAPIDIPAETEWRSLEEQLKLAARNFLVKTTHRNSIIAGYPWFTDWGRDTMISLPGICLKTGNVDSARRILADYSTQMRQGIIPNRFVEAGEQPQYNTVDATLWFVNAVYETLNMEWDPDFAGDMLKIFAKIFDWHTRGTFYGIKVDPSDGLLNQGEEGIQLTWMDAKIGDWVVTPRHGKPVEINGLWINAMRIMQWLASKLNDPGRATYSHAAQLAEDNFERKFWSERRGHYADTVEPDDVSLRPNQLIAMSLPFGPAKGENALKALKCVEDELLTDRGLRTLASTEPNYCGRFKGPMEDLDAAYHQGTVWPWLIGPYISASIRLRGNADGLDNWKDTFQAMLQENGLMGVAEVYDGDEPRTPGGCPWQAWSVAEMLRVFVDHSEISVAKAP